ncbi:hypothetical protein ACFVHQ_03075 [Actinomycetes bacterium NPDC127524]
MDQQRKKIIIQEISYWKKNRMLPDTYCDYLLALYSEGAESVQPKARKSYIKLWLCIIVGLLVAVNLFLNYFTEFPVGLQISLLTFSVLLLAAIAYFLFNKKTLFQVPLIGCAFSLLLETVTAAEQLSSHKHIILYILLLLQCLIWVFAGRKLKLPYFIIAGILGACVVLFFISKLYSIF